jgi:mono/diheme cytochrome c family protein
VIATTLVALSVGCGGAHDTTRVEGRRIFVSQCAACHTLTGHEQGAVGGDLVLAHLHAKDVASFARVMPTKRPLSAPDARAVASYVVSVASRGGLFQAQP